jgi:hypothetical protein
MPGRRRGGPPGPSEAALAAAWDARRCVCCDGVVCAVLLADALVAAGNEEINLCAAHFRARMTEPVLLQISQLRGC